MYFCMDCGERLEEKSHTEFSDKYYCPHCHADWFKTKRIIIEWTKQKINPTQRLSVGRERE